ncbi:hypothetical protein SDC9_142627 [bioreactor metagenome]|uniref:Uncharacterized protein n=1 Tax=bioreactor metagenome TaxID=1076179 RepID=A0A645E3U3_9ZZZZ
MVIVMMKNRIILIMVTLIVIFGGVILCFFSINHNKIYSNGINSNVIDSSAKLLNLLGMDFTDVKITNIQYQNNKEKDVGEYTKIIVFLEESDEALKSREYYLNNLGGGISDPNLRYIPPGHIEELGEIGIDINQIKQHGGNYNEVEVGGQFRPYEIHWYELNEIHYKGNVLLLTSIPCKVVLDVDKIIQNSPTIKK